MMKRTCSDGQTLLEVVVVIAVVAIVLTALVSSVTAALKYGQSSQFRSQAVKLAQDGIEVSRKSRDTNWDTFYDYSTQNSGKWCLDDNGVFTQAPNSGKCEITPGSSFWRLVTFAYDTSDPQTPQMVVQVKVTWGLRNDASTVLLTTYLTEWR